MVTTLKCRGHKAGLAAHFDSLISSQANVGQLGSDLACSHALLASLPNGEVMLSTASALGAATAVFPATSVTDRLFGDLRQPLERVRAGQREVAVADELEDGVEVLVPARHLGRDGVRARIA